MNGNKKIQILFILLLSVLTGCEKSPVHDFNPEPNGELNDFVPPKYTDDYSSLSSWETRNLWNLANVHDPTVAKSENYYFNVSST